MSRKHTWGSEITLPDPAAKDWHCKYRVTALRSLVNTRAENSTAGKILVEVVMTGFTENAFLILQPHQSFSNFKD